MKRYKVQGLIRKNGKVQDFTGFGHIHEFKFFYPEPYSSFNFIGMTDCKSCFNASTSDQLYISGVEPAEKKRGRKNARQIPSKAK